MPPHTSTRDQIAARARAAEREGQYERALQIWELLVSHDRADRKAGSEAARLRGRIARLKEIDVLLAGPDEELERALAAAVEDEDHFVVVQLRRAQLARERTPTT